MRAGGIIPSRRGAVVDTSAVYDAPAPQVGRQDNDWNIASRRRDAVPETVTPPEPHIVTAGANRIQWGRLAAIPTDGTLQPVLQTPMASAAEQDLLVTLSCRTLPPSGVALFKVIFAQGATTFTKTLLVSSDTELHSVIVTARWVQVSCQCISGTAGSTFQVSATVTPSTYSGVASQYLWNPCVNVGLSDHAALYSGISGVAGRVAVTLTTPETAGAVVWPLLFDALSTPAANALPISNGTLPSLKAIGDTAVLDVGTNPGTVAWAKGLFCALSTTPEKYVAVAAAQAYFQAIVGT